MNLKIKAAHVCVMVGFALHHLTWSQTVWNPALSETQKAAASREFEAYQQRLRNEPLHAVVEVDYGHHVPPSVICRIGVLGRTNVTLYKPLPAQAFDAHLFDDEGKEVKKTLQGRQFGEVPKPDMKLLDGSFRMDKEAMYGRSRELPFGSGAGASVYWSFDIWKSFRVKDDGQYRLVVEVRLFYQETNGTFKPLILPPVEKQVKLVKSELK